jgi:hypothetical protein
LKTKWRSPIYYSKVDLEYNKGTKLARKTRVISATHFTSSTSCLNDKTASYTVIPKSNTKSELKPRRFDGAICGCKTINKVVKKTRIQPDVIKKRDSN